MKVIVFASLLLSILIPLVQCACPCQNPALCKPINTTGNEVFAFSVQNNASTWQKFDWHKLTTVVSFGYISTDLMCLAHQNGVRVAILGNYKLSELTNATLRSQWVNKKLFDVQSNYYDGLNIDFEDPILDNQTEIRDAFTALVKEAYDAFKQSNPNYQVTVDVSWSPDCIDDRCYDNRGLAENTDFLFVMAYDEQSQMFEKTCTALANSDFTKTGIGMSRYLQLGIGANKLVLGVPWYGYDYECLSLSKDNVCTIQRVPYREANCSDAAGHQLPYQIIYPMMVNHSSGGRQWDFNAISPFFNYKDPAKEQMHQVRYDDPMSLRIKYSIASLLGLRGVGMWTIDSLDYSDATYAKEQTKEMFDALPYYPR